MKPPKTATWQKRIDQLEEVVEQYSAALFAKQQEVTALKQQLADLNQAK
jgi:hypothetical protein